MQVQPRCCHYAACLLRLKSDQRQKPFNATADRIALQGFQTDVRADSLRLKDQ